MSASDAALASWAASGAMWLTGRPDGPPMTSPGAPATRIATDLSALADATTRRTGSTPRLPDCRLLGERAAIAGLTRQGPWSCGGSFRALPTVDSWLGISLARPSDLDLVPALLEVDEIGDPWAELAEWAKGRTTDEAAARVALLGLPGRGVRTTPPKLDRGAVVHTPGGVRARVRERPLVLDFTSLWAGPLCAHLLGLGGAEVIKVESVSRLDGARRGPKAFFDLLHHGHRSVTVDFADPAQRAALLELARTADVILEASRPRALAALGLPATDLVADGLIWVSITAQGRDVDAVGFGDDVAAGAGLVALDHEEVLPCGDALADPLAGVAAARATAQALLEDHGALLDVSMHAVSTEAGAGGPIGAEVEAA